MAKELRGSSPTTTRYETEAERERELCGVADDGGGDRAVAERWKRGRAPAESAGAALDAVKAERRFSGRTLRALDGHLDGDRARGRLAQQHHLQLQRSQLLVAG